MRMKKAIICDIDGTLTNDSMSIPLDIDVRTSKDKFYDAVNGYKTDITRTADGDITIAYGKSTGIKPVWGLIDTLVQHMKNDVEVFFVTAREADEAYNTRQNTLDLLRILFDDRIKDEQLLMRPYGDYRYNYEVKEDLVKTNILNDYDVLFALDDEEMNVEMFQSLGILTLQVKHGKE